MVAGRPVVAAPGRLTAGSMREKECPMAGVVSTSRDTGTPSPDTTSTSASCSNQHQRLESGHQFSFMQIHFGPVTYSLHACAGLSIRYDLCICARRRGNCSEWTAIHLTHRVVDVRGTHQPRVVEGGVQVLGAEVVGVEGVEVHKPAQTPCEHSS